MHCIVCQSTVLWLDHVNLAREAILLVLADEPEEVLRPTRAQLLDNQKAIGEWFEHRLHAKEIGTQLTALLTEHVLQELGIVAVLRQLHDPEVRKAEQTRLNSAVRDMIRDWRTNAGQITTLLSEFSDEHELKPSWEAGKLHTFFMHHLDKTLEEAKAWADRNFTLSMLYHLEVKSDAMAMSEYFMAPFRKLCKGQK